MVGLKPYQIVCKESPLNPEQVWQIESFLLKILEYGNYSFRQALCGTYHEKLKSVFYLAYDGESIIGVAGALFSADNPVSAIFSPVAVDSDYRRRGIATGLCLKLLDHLKQQGIRCAYIGVSQEHPARQLYYRLGFSDLTGIVMAINFESGDSGRPNDALDYIYADLSWQDYAEVLGLLCQPSSFLAFDYQRVLFSSKYEPVKQFLPVFPELMRSLDKNKGCGKVIRNSRNAEIFGLAQISGPQSGLQNHVSYLDFFGHDDHLSNLEALVKEVCLEYRRKRDCQILSWIPEPDESKKIILEKLGGRRIAMIPNTIVLNNKMHNVEVFQL